MKPIVVIGDALLDRDVEGEAVRLAPDAPVPVLDEHHVRTRPGGGALAAVLATGRGRDVILITALARDRAGQELRRLLEHHGVEVVDLGASGRTPEKIRLRAGHQLLARWDRGSPDTMGGIGGWDAHAERATDAAGAILVACYGRGLTTRDDVRDAIVRATDRIPVVWDPHPRGPDPVTGVSLATPNDREVAARLTTITDGGLPAVAARASELVRRWGIGGVVVTLGARGALLSTGDGLPLMVPANPVASGDPCGAGDQFSATVTTHLAQGAVLSEAVTAAVHEASDFVERGGAGQLQGTRADRVPAASRGGGPSALARRVRSQGGTVVATGGCFDLLHAGHVQLLQAARRLGDCLIVCLNSDASVRRLKGPSRPVVTARDRRRLLKALRCVDDVEIFDEDTPVEALRRLRPQIFAKGGDYGTSAIPEERELATWGGQAVTLPYFEGHSTTSLLQEVRHHD